MLKKILSDMELTDDECSIVVYGLRRLAMFVASILVTFIIGMATGTTRELFFFLLLFIPLRIFAGGLHLPSLRLCAMTSSLLILFVVVFTKAVNKDIICLPWYVYTSILASTIIIVLAPVDTDSKILYGHEKKKYKLIAVLLTLAELLICICFDISGKIKLLAFLSNATESIYLLIQSIVNCIKKANEWK